MALQIRGKPSPCFPQQTAQEVSVHHTTTEQSPLFFQITAVIRLLNTRCWSHPSSQGVLVQGQSRRGVPGRRMERFVPGSLFPQSHADALDAMPRGRMRASAAAQRCCCTLNGPARAGKWCQQPPTHQVSETAKPLTLPPNTSSVPQELGFSSTFLNTCSKTHNWASFPETHLVYIHLLSSKSFRI